MAPPMPVKPEAVATSRPRNRSVGNACRFDTQNACPKVTKHVAAMAIHAAGTNGARIATGRQHAPSSITNLRERGRVHPLRMKYADSHPPSTYPIPPNTNGTHAYFPT